MNLTQQEKEIIESMRMGSRSQDTQGRDEYRQVKGNLNSSLHILLSNASRSNNPIVKDRANSLLRELNSQGGLHNINLSDSQYQGLIKEAHEAANLDDSLVSDYSLVAETATTYNQGVTDKEYGKELKQSIKEGQSDLYREDSKIIINEMTGTKFIKEADGSISTYVETEETYEEASTSSDNKFLQSGGEQQSFLDGLVDK